MGHQPSHSGPFGRILQPAWIIQWAYSETPPPLLTCGVYINFNCIYGCSDEGGENGDRKEWTEIPGKGEIVDEGLLYADDLVLCGESEQGLRAVVGRFVEVGRKIGLKVNAGKSKVIVMNREEGLECEVHIDGIRVEHVS